MITVLCLVQQKKFNKKENIMNKRNFLVIISAALMLTLWGQGAFAEKPTKGDFGNGFHWEFNPNNGALTISGSGEMPDCPSAQWHYYWDSEIKSAKFKNGITKIGDATLYGCTNLERVTIPDGVKIIGNTAFANCQKLQKINLPNSLEEIGLSSFQACSGLTKITLPQNVKSIGNSAFINCTRLTDIQIPEGVSIIAGGTFAECTSLFAVDLPSSIKQINTNAFQNCRNLKRLAVNWVGNAIPYAGIIFSNAFTSTDTPPYPIWENITVRVPYGTSGDYKKKGTDKPNWNTFKDIVEDNAPGTSANDKTAKISFIQPDEKTINFAIIN